MIKVKSCCPHALCTHRATMKPSASKQGLAQLRSCDAVSMSPGYAGLRLALALSCTNSKRGVVSDDRRILRVWFSVTEGFWWPKQSTIAAVWAKDLIMWFWIGSTFMAQKPLAFLCVQQKLEEKWGRVMNQEVPRYQFSTMTRFGKVYIF